MASRSHRGQWVNMSDSQLAYIEEQGFHTSCTWYTQGSHVLCINSLAPVRSYCDFENVIFNLALLIGIFKSSNDNVLRWMPQNLTDDKSTLVQVMAWCRQATNHYLNQCWPRSPMPYGITRPQWVNSWALGGLNKKKHFLSNFSDWWLGYLLLNCPQMNVIGPYW